MTSLVDTNGTNIMIDIMRHISRFFAILVTQNGQIQTAEDAMAVSYTFYGAAAVCLILAVIISVAHNLYVHNRKKVA